MEARGIALDVAYLEEMGESVRDRMATLKAEIYEQAGEEFNLNSPPQLRKILYDQLGLQPGKKTPEGRAVDRRQRAREAARRPPDRRRAAAAGASSTS